MQTVTGDYNLPTTITHLGIYNIDSDVVTFAPFLLLSLLLFYRFSTKRAIIPFHEHANSNPLQHQTFYGF